MLASDWLRSSMKTGEVARNQLLRDVAAGIPSGVVGSGSSDAELQFSASHFPLINDGLDQPKLTVFCLLGHFCWCFRPGLVVEESGSGAGAGVKR